MEFITSVARIQSALFRLAELVNRPTHVSRLTMRRSAHTRRSNPHGCALLSDDRVIGHGMVRAAPPAAREVVANARIAWYTKSTAPARWRGRIESHGQAEEEEVDRAGKARSGRCGGKAVTEAASMISPSVLAVAVMVVLNAQGQ